MLCHGFSGKIASPNSTALRNVVPSVSLETVAFPTPRVEVPPQTLRLPAGSALPHGPRLKGCDSGLNKLGILFLGVGLPLTEMTGFHQQRDTRETLLPLLWRGSYFISAAVDAGPSWPLIGFKTT